MGQCWFCGANSEELVQCPSCKKEYCNLHSEFSSHDCPGTPIVDIAPMPASNYVAPVDSTPTPLKTSESEGYTPTDEEVERSTQDGSYVWHGKTDIPGDAFNPESGVEMKMVFWQKGSEAAHLLIGGALMFLFGYVTFSGLTQIFAGYPIPQIEIWHILLIAGIFTGSFLGHEFGHRQVAKRNKLQTKFRLFTSGLLITTMSIIMGFFGIPGFGFPGAVVVIGLDEISRATGHCKIAGPVVNLIIGAILCFVALIPLQGFLYFPWNFVLYYGAYFNFQLGIFNMIPVGALDGYNIIKWRPKLWALLMVTLAGFFIFILVTLFDPYFVPRVFLDWPI